MFDPLYQTIQTSVLYHFWMSIEKQPSLYGNIKSSVSFNKMWLFYSTLYTSGCGFSLLPYFLVTRHLMTMTIAIIISVMASCWITTLPPVKINKHQYNFTGQDKSKVAFEILLSLWWYISSVALRAEHSSEGSNNRWIALGYLSFRASLAVISARSV